MSRGYLRSITWREENFYQPPTLSGVREMAERKIINYLAWRRDMALWLLDTSRIFDIHPATVEAALSVLDRLASIDKDVTEDFELYQLACFVCLLISCKFFESKRIFKRSKVQDLILDCFSQEELDHMEFHILYSLKWLVQPPTTIDIARELLDLVPQEIIPDRCTIDEIVSASLKVGIVDSRFLPFRASSIALASVLCALEPILKPQYLLEVQNCLLDAMNYVAVFDQELEKLKIMISSATQLEIIHCQQDSDSLVEYVDPLRNTGLRTAEERRHKAQGPDTSPRTVITEK